MNSRRDWMSLVRWIKATVTEAEANPDVGGNRDLQARAVASLRAGDPETAGRLERAGVLEAFGVAVEFRMWQEADEMEAQGLNPLEALSQAMMTWMDFEPDQEPGWVEQVEPMPRVPRRGRRPRG